MIQCDRCDRHIRETEVACPFCNGPSRLKMAMSVVGGAVTTIVLAACYGPPDGGFDKYPTGNTGDTAATTPTGDTGATSNTTTLSGFDVPNLEREDTEPGTCDPGEVTPH